MTSSEPAAVFLYEDENTFREAALTCLKNKGCRVILAFDGVSLEEAVKEIKALYREGGTLLAMVVDLWVPILDGFDAIENLEAAVPQTTSVPLIIWTDSPTPESHEKWIQIQGHLPRMVVVKSEDPVGSAQDMVTAI